MQSIIPAGHFKTHCLQLMEEVAQTGHEIVITKHGKPIAKLAPITEEKKDYFGLLQGAAVITGDIISPLDEQWDAQA